MMKEVRRNEGHWEWHNPGWNMNGWVNGEKKGG
jgi:hypothetical protein